MRDHWKSYYNNQDIVVTGNYQKNVGRTAAGKPIPEQIWEDTLSYIINLLGVREDHVVLELCCGNGAVIGPLAALCGSAVGVDYSKELLQQLTERFGDQVAAIHSDVLDVEFDSDSFDLAVVYFSLQHFSERDAIQIVQNTIKWLKPGGKLFIGDVPNELKKFEYINLPEYRRNYVSRLINEQPSIGNWFQPAFFESIGDYFGNLDVTIVNQPEYQINSHYRFDVVIEKIA